MNRHPKLEPYVQIKTRADITDLILSKVKKLTTPRAAITDLKGEELIKKKKKSHAILTASDNCEIRTGYTDSPT